VAASSRCKSRRSPTSTATWAPVVLGIAVLLAACRTPSIVANAGMAPRKLLISPR